MKPKHRRKEHYYVKQPKSKSQLGLIRTDLRGHFFEFLTSSSVFSKKRIDLGTRLLIESIILPEKGWFLDLGCGYGPVGLVAAVSNPNLQVVMVDVNERAVWLAKENAKRCHVENVDIRHGFLYKPVRDMRFDSVVCNPPVSAGMHVVLAVVEDAPKHLEKDGLFQIVLRSKIGSRRVLEQSGKTFGNVEILARKSGYRVLLSKKS